MRILTNLIFKVTLSSMIITAPAMTTGAKDPNFESSLASDLPLPYYSSTVIKKYVHFNEVKASDERLERKERMFREATLARSRELKMVLSEAVILYDYMSLEKTGLSEEAFEYAWRGYHNLVKQGRIKRQNVLSICDFSQSSCSKRLYVIDVRHKKLLYRTYVAHGANSGGEYANSFSNEPDSYKSSLGFYLTKRTYFGKNGLSLRIEGVDVGYNDLAGKRNIVLHGSSYVSVKYMNDNGLIGNSLGCPAMPLAMSPKIIHSVRDGSCFFIYHPTKTYLDGSTIING